MPEKLQVPLDRDTVEGLRALGHDVITNTEKRAAFLKDPQGTLKAYNIFGLDARKLDAKVIDMLASPGFREAVEHKDFDAVRKFVATHLRAGSPQPTMMSTFDFDFDVEVEVEIVAVAVAVFDFAAAKSTIPNEAELVRRQEIVKNAFAALGKQVGVKGQR